MVSEKSIGPSFQGVFFSVLTGFGVFQDMTGTAGSSPGARVRNLKIVETCGDVNKKFLSPAPEVVFRRLSWYNFNKYNPLTF
jgi:hypothetical protein